MAKRKHDDDDVSVDFGFGKFSLGGLANGLEKLVNLAERLEERGGEIRKEGEIKFDSLKKDGKPLKGVFGLSVKTGLAGKPVVESFGNIRKTPKGPVVEDEREPMVDIFDEKKEIVIMAEMPGVGADDIKLDLKGDILEISARDGNRNYRKEILLSAPVVPESMKSNYNNGILEIKLDKQK
ncbi:MAG: Hsp20/alpha crystallin family protein [Victivallaceae bacterium]|nr:Hsp20/alpha crystallin family protein [Victivallaceae bacterium]